VPAISSFVAAGMALRAFVLLRHISAATIETIEFF
jgi:hypothetical protein